ncbi:hypothetical protein MMC25_006772 [Agyrium rufum]|nr:hypothetical protein [Agyrium rufum]
MTRAYNQKLADTTKDRGTVYQSSSKTLLRQYIWRIQLGHMPCLELPSATTLSSFKKLEQQSVIVLGVTNSSQWGIARLSNDNNSYKSQLSNGYSARGGQTYELYRIRKDPSGSSSRLAVTTSLQLALADVGNEERGRAVEVSALEKTVSIMAKAGAIVVDPADYSAYATFFPKSPQLTSIHNNADWKAQLDNYVL